MLPLCQTPHVARVISQPVAATSKLSCQQRAMTNIQQSSTRMADAVPSSSSSGKCSKSTLAAIVAAAIALQPIQAGLELLSPPTARAHVAIDKLMQQQQQQALQQISTGGFDPGASAAARGQAAARSTVAPRPSSSRNSRQGSSSVASAASEALQQLSAAEAASAAGNYQAALQAYSSVVQDHPDLALAEYARLGRAIMLYQLGETSKSIIALEDQELSMRGYPEVHAALAAVLYAERPAQRLRAEQQWDIALEFDSRYQDLDWVAKNKRWPPALVQALQRFLLLQ